MTLTDKYLYARKDVSQNFKIYYGTNTITPLPSYSAFLGVTYSNDTTNKVLTITVAPNAVGSGSGSFGSGLFSVQIISYELNSDTQSIYNNRTDICCTDSSLELVWLNREGGFENFHFDIIRTAMIRHTGGELVYMNTDRELRYSSVGDFYHGGIIETEIADKRIMKKLRSLKMAIQVWDGGNSLPLKVDLSGLEMFTNKNNSVMPFEFTFIYSKKIDIQNQ